MYKTSNLLFVYLLFAVPFSIWAEKQNRNQNKVLQKGNVKPNLKPQPNKLITIPDSQEDKDNIARIIKNGSKNGFYTNEEMIELLKYPNPSNFCRHQVDPINIWKDKEHKMPNLIGKGSFGTVYKGQYTPDGVNKNGLRQNFTVAAKYQDYTLETRLLILKEINFLRIMSKYSKHHMAFYNCFYELDSDRRDHVNKAILMMGIMTGDAQGLIDNKKEHPQLKRNWPKLKSIFTNMAKGIRDMHWLKIMHRDIKPANFLINKKGDPIVADLGLASFVFRDGKSGIMGTPYFMAPEVVAGKVHHFPADIYSLGITFYSIYCGENPDKFVSFDLGKISHEPTSHPYYHLLKDSKFLGLIQAMTLQDPTKRPTAIKVIESLTNMNSNVNGNFPVQPIVLPPQGLFKKNNRNLECVFSKEIQQQKSSKILVPSFRII